MWTVYLVWHLRGRWKIRRAGPRRLIAVRHRIWREPTSAEAGRSAFRSWRRRGVPVPPFRFVEEHLAGSQPCVAVRDARDRLWRVEVGTRGQAGSVCRAPRRGVRLLRRGHTLRRRPERSPSVKDLARARQCIADDGWFADARFELEDRDVRMLFDEHSWAWNDNPFVGTRQLSGLKIVTMLLSNWDTKDRRDVARGSNTAIFEVPVGAGVAKRAI